MINIIFLVFLFQFSSSVALRCLSKTRKSDSSKDLETCLISMNMNQPFPRETELINDYKCVQSDSTNGIDQFYCVAGVIIDYGSRTIHFDLNHFSASDNDPLYQGLFPRYDSHTKQQTKYIISSDPGKSKLHFVMTFMCMTHDNCAVEQLRKLLPIELRRTGQRMKILQQLNVIMNKPSLTTKSTNLMYTESV